MPKFEPVRWYLIVSAVLAIVAYYVEIPVELFVTLAAAWFGVGGEVVRAHTIPTARFEDPADRDDEVVADGLDA